MKELPYELRPNPENPIHVPVPVAPKTEKFTSDGQVVEGVEMISLTADLKKDLREIGMIGEEIGLVNTANGLCFASAAAVLSILTKLKTMALESTKASEVAKLGESMAKMATAIQRQAQTMKSGHDPKEERPPTHGGVSMSFAPETIVNFGPLPGQPVPQERHIGAIDIAK